MKKNKPTKNNKSTRRRSGKLPQKKGRSRNVWLNVLPKDLWVKARRGQTVWEVLSSAGIDSRGDCDGLGKCGKCKIKVLSAIGPPAKETLALLSAEEIGQGIRLACRTKLRKDLMIHLGDSDPEAEYVQILKSGERPTMYLDPLVIKRPVTLPREYNEAGIADLERVKLSLGSEYREMTASLHCLRHLPMMLDKTRGIGTAVIHDRCMMAWQPVEEMSQQYGLVFDLGTTTLVGKLIDLETGSEVAAVSRMNGQARYGSDVITRLQYVGSRKNGLERLHQLLVNDMAGITNRLLEIGSLRPREIFIAVAAGNTTMQHLLLKIDPQGIAGAPFAPVLTGGTIVGASQIGLPLHPEALVYVMPARSGYIGGDLLGVIIASGAAAREDGIYLGLDLGTNGEIFVGNGRRLVACSAAAGPAMEGARISAGMNARTGAIEGVRTMTDDTLQYSIIGNAKPRGLCGSGLVDLVAVLLHNGLVDREGLIQPPAETGAADLARRLVPRDGVYDYQIAPADDCATGRPLYLTQKDVRELQLAKGAVAAGIDILLSEVGVGVGDISQIYLAGALGNYINPYSAMRIGLLPTVSADIITSLGNAASIGASMVLLSRAYWEMAAKLNRSIEYVELSQREDFNRRFIEHLDFPGVNLW